MISIFDKVAQRVKPVVSDVPLPFEAMDINTGFVLYETELTDEQKNVTNPVNLTLKSVRDRAIIYTDQVKLNHKSYSVVTFALKYVVSGASGNHVSVKRQHHPKFENYE